MKKLFLVLIAFVLFSGHDMYLKLDTYFLQPNTPAIIMLFNGTFDKSENVIAHNRMIDMSLVGNGRRVQVDTAQWSEKDSMTLLSFTTGEAGTWVAGVSTRPRNIEMTAADFNDYLEHDGVLDMLDGRKENNALDQNAVEKYSKHVKAIFQVGDKLTEDWQTALGYPIEFIALSNPYDLHVGHDMQVQLLWQGEPLANQLVYVDSHGHSHGHADEAGHAHSDEHEHADAAAHEHTDAVDHEHSDEHADAATHDHEHADAADHEHSDEHEHADAAAHDHEHTDAADHEHSDEHEHADAAAHDHDHTDAADHAHSDDHDHADAPQEDHHHHAATQARTDANGILTFNLTNDGVWYLRTIYMTHSEEPGLTHESNWATLTFEVGQGHSHDETAHSHAEGIPAYVYWLGSLVLLIGLFFWFNRKN